MTRQETIRWLLATFNDAREPLRTGTGGGDGQFSSRALTYPKSWTHSYQVLERHLGLLKQHDRSLYWHVCERYLRCKTSTITVIVERETTRGTLKEPRRVVIELWDPKVQLALVDRAIEWLSDTIKEDLYLPKDLWQVANP